MDDDALVYYTNHAGVVAVSVDGWTDGFIFLPDGRAVEVGHPWVEANEQHELTDAQRERVEPLLAGLEDKMRFRDELAVEILDGLGQTHIESDIDIDELLGG